MIYVKCQFLGFSFPRPAPNITWKKDGKTIVNGQNSFTLFEYNRKLVISTVSKADHEGTYTCEATSSVKTATTSTNLKVKGMQHYRVPKYD